MARPRYPVMDFFCYCLAFFISTTHSAKNNFCHLTTNLKFVLQRRTNMFHVKHAQPLIAVTVYSSEITLCCVQISIGLTFAGEIPVEWNARDAVENGEVKKPPQVAGLSGFKGGGFRFLRFAGAAHFRSSAQEKDVRF